MISNQNNFCFNTQMMIECFLINKLNFQSNNYKANKIQAINIKKLQKKKIKYLNNF